MNLTKFSLRNKLDYLENELYKSDYYKERNYSVEVVNRVKLYLNDFNLNIILEIFFKIQKYVKIKSEFIKLIENRGV